MTTTTAYRKLTQNELMAEARERFGPDQDESFAEAIRRADAEWPLPQVEIEDAEQLGLVVRPESPAAADYDPDHDHTLNQPPAVQTVSLPGVSS